MEIEITAQQVIIVVILFLVLYFIWKKTRRFSSVKDLPRNCKGLKLTGIVTSVADGDGFGFQHTPLLRFNKSLSHDKTLKVRLAGIDAPETQHFGIPAQPLAKESKEYLKSLILKKKVTLEILGIDRYERVLAIVHIRSFCSSTFVNLEMINTGMACVYEGSDEVFGDYKEVLLDAEAVAKSRRLGIWNLEDLILPMEYKKMMKNKKQLQA